MYRYLQCLWIATRLNEIATPCRYDICYFDTFWARIQYLATVRIVQLILICLFRFHWQLSKWRERAIQFTYFEIALQWWTRILSIFFSWLHTNKLFFSFEIFQGANNTTRKGYRALNWLAIQQCYATILWLQILPKHELFFIQMAHRWSNFGWLLRKFRIEMWRISKRNKHFWEKKKQTVAVAYRNYIFNFTEKFIWWIMKYIYYIFCACTMYILCLLLWLLLLLWPLSILKNKL